MRSLQTTDIFAACRMLSKIGVREEIREVALKAEESKTKKIRVDMGFDLMFGILEKATQEKAENEIYQFLSGIFECDPEEIRVMDPFVLFEKLGEVADFEKWKSFFKLAVGSMK